MAAGSVVGGGRRPVRGSKRQDGAAEQRTGGHDPAPNNALLSGLPRRVQERLMPLLERVAVNAHTIVIEPNEPLRHIWFPTTAVFSIITILPDGRAVEVGTAGPEGMVGIPVLLGVGSMPRQAFVQIAGEALRMDAEAFTAALDEHPEMRRRLLRYAHAYLDDIAQSVACNRLHSLEQRCARWILKTHDRVRGDHLPLTQQFLAFMLGVRRAGVSVAAEALQRAGLIRYQRGKIMILDREGLEAASCPCYAINRDNFQRVVGGGDGELSVAD